MNQEKSKGPAKQGARIAVRIIVLVLVALILGTTVYNLNAKNLVGEQMPMPFGFGVSVVVSGSMEPELSVNDLIVVTEADELYVGQVIVYQVGSTLVVHRIKSINDDEIITRGDANNTDDAPISADMIKGEVAFAIPFVGMIIRLLQNPIVAVALIALALYLLERSYRAEKSTKNDELAKIKEEIKKEIEELKSKKND